MKAREANLNKFLASNDTQFIIPVYQRNYVWTNKQCKTLIDDILRAGDSKNITAHFIGSVVYIHDDVYTTSDIRELIIIDGQQRLTTVTLIYIILLHLAEKSGDENQIHRIKETYLINKFADEKGKLKLRPTDNNERALRELLKNDDSGLEYSNIVENYRYLSNRINNENFDVVITGLKKLMYVEISLERGKDDSQRIFESLNSTGLELSQADLIRNYVLMGHERTEQNRIYDEYWEVIENNAKDIITNENKVSDFIRDFLTIENKKIPNKKQVYQEFKDKYSNTNLNEIERVLKELKMYVYHYDKLLNPTHESNRDIQPQLNYIKRLEINVSYPFLLKVFADYCADKINKDIFIAVLELIQSFTWRRFIVGLPTNALNKIFMSLYDSVEQGNYLYSIEKALLRKKGTQRFPRDEEVLRILEEKDVYGIQSKNRVYFLERLENFNNVEKVIIDGNSEITIEHIFPQKPVSKWKIQLGEKEYDLMKTKYLNTIANLTLSGNNGNLANKTFLEKRDMNKDGREQGYKFSRLWLNKQLAELNKWDSKQLLKRYEKISKRFLSIWKFPEVDLGEDLDNDEISIFEADHPTHKKLSHVVFFDEKINIREVSKLYLKVMSELFDLEPKKFFTTELGERVSITKDISKLHTPQKLNEVYYIEGNFDSKNKFNRIKLALTTYDCEDELYIKFEDTNQEALKLTQ